MKQIRQFYLSIPNEIEITFLDYGGIIQSIRVPDKNGLMEDIVLGFDHPKEYQQEHPYFGAIIGRYANRIFKGQFELDGKKIQLNVNDPPSTLHGGNIGFDKVFWNVSQGLIDNTYHLSYSSSDQEEGFPGNLKVDVTYHLTNNRELVIDYRATTDQTTPLNLTNHSYFNLNGVKKDQNILGHELWINADHFTDVDNNLIPTGEILSVDKAKDFREHKLISEALSLLPNGLDHNYVLNNAPLRDPKARLRDLKSNRMLEVFTTEPGIQIYTGNFLDGSIKGKGEVYYQKHQGICLETQHFPDSPNHLNFPTTLLRAGEVYNSKTIYRFS